MTGVRRVLFRSADLDFAPSSLLMLQFEDLSLNRTSYIASPAFCTIYNLIPLQIRTSLRPSMHPSWQSSKTTLYPKHSTMYPPRTTSPAPASLAVTSRLARRMRMGSASSLSG